VATLVAIAVVAGLLVWHFASGSDDGSGGGASKTVKPAAIPAPLVQGTASADYDLSTREVAGVPRGFPQTVDGAVEAFAAMDGQLSVVGADLTADARGQLLEDVGYGQLPGITSLVKQTQRRYHLTSDGQPTTGEPGDRFYSDCLPQYGMYHVGQVTPNQAKPTRVIVTVWMPRIQGIGSPSHIDDLRIDWSTDTAAVVWKNGDWRLPVEKAPEGPKVSPPSDRLRPNVSVAERAQLAAGNPNGFWRLFKGYSEAWPTDLLGPEPKEASQ